ncbi:unnamed protein product [Mesocestoides corti]|uniref:Secreted protein n=1 Tax=Mesocestoides corti TaxID=53468 RepID=A0A0R3UDR6_MESCO|nr:unnamed protein product [Mesocestoides corti]
MRLLILLLRHRCIVMNTQPLRHLPYMSSCTPDFLHHLPSLPFTRLILLTAEPPTPTPTPHQESDTPARDKTPTGKCNNQVFVALKRAVVTFTVVFVIVVDDEGVWGWTMGWG